MSAARSAPQRLLFLRPHTPPPDGLTWVPVDADALFDLIPRVGRAAALLWLTLRTLRQRAARSPATTVGQIPLSTLAWVHRATPRQCRRWLDRLSRHRLVIYTLDSERSTAAVTIEFVPGPIRPPRFDDAGPTTGRLRLSSHYALHVMPRLGRTVYWGLLYLRSREPARTRGAVFSFEDMATTLDLWGTWQARLIFLALRWHQVVIRHPRGAGFIVREPAPLRRWQRRILLARAVGHWPRTRTAFTVYLLGTVAFVVVLIYFLHTA